MTSIRRNLMVRIIRDAVLLLLTSSVLLGVVIRGLDIREFDSALETKARILATLVLQEGHVIEIDFADEYMPEFKTSENPEYFQFRLPDGSVIERSDALGDVDLPFMADATERPVFRNLRLPDGRRGRFVQIAFPPRSHPGRENEGGNGGDGASQIAHTADPQSGLVVLILARSRENLNTVLLSVYCALAAAAVGLVFLIGWSVRRSIQEGFRPLGALNQQIRAFDPSALHQRIHLPHAPDELRPVLSALNGFIERLQAAFMRERRFSSDVAHELRTPVAELRASCEVGMKWPDDPELVRRRFEGVLHSAANMERLVSNLLELARCDAGMLKLNPSTVHVSALLNECWELLAQKVEQNQLHLDNRVDPALTCDTDSAKLSMLAQNLLSNAVSYSVQGTVVVCKSVVTDTDIRISISNQTSGLGQEDIPHVFERFWRKDPARTGAHHSGLGLAIVEALADVLGIELQVGLSGADVFTVTLSYPSQLTH